MVSDSLIQGASYSSYFLFDTSLVLIDLIWISMKQYQQVQKEMPLCCHWEGYHIHFTGVIFHHVDGMPGKAKTEVHMDVLYQQRKESFQKLQNFLKNSG